MYMGATTSSDGSYRYDRAQVMTSVLKRFFLLLTLTRINTRMCAHIYSLFVVLIPLVIIFYIISDNLMELSLAYCENAKARCRDHHLLQHHETEYISDTFTVLSCLSTSCLVLQCDSP